MPNTVYSDIFRTIISKDNRYNLDIFDKLAQSVLKDGMRDIALAMVEGITDWEYQFILIPDNEEFKTSPNSKYMGKAILLGESLRKILGPLYASDLPEKKPEGVGPCDLSEIDLAGWCKLIHFRFLNEQNIGQFLIGENKYSLDHFMSLIMHVNVLRNEISHENENTIRKYQNEKNTRRVFSDLLRRTEKSEECVKTSLHNGEKIAEILLHLKDQIQSFSDMFDLSIQKHPIDKNGTDSYPVEYLYGFDRVYLAYPTCLNRNYLRFITGELNPLMIRGRSNLAVDEGTVEYLADLSMSVVEKQAEEAKRFCKALDNDLKETLSMVRLPADEDIPLHYTERFLKQLKASKESICVITDDDYLCREILSLPDNIVVVCVENITQVRPYYITEKENPELNASDYVQRNKAIIPAQRSMVYYGSPANDVQYTLKECIGSGGEGNIYRTDIGRECFKIYHEEKLTAKRQEKIRKMLSIQELKQEKKVCWPKEAIYESSSRHLLVGFSMPDVAAVADSDVVTLEELVLSLQNGDTFEWGWNRKDLLNLCMDIVELLIHLHKVQVLVGDLNPKNILVDRKGEVFFIDADSYQIEDYLCTVGIPEYTSPRLWEKECNYSEMKRTIEDESFALARLLYYILFLGDSPYDLNDNTIDMENLKDCILHKKFRLGASIDTEDYIWLNCSEGVKQCFMRTFYSEDGVDHPQDYPDNRQWLNALYEMSQIIDAGELSNELRPSDAIREKGEAWEEKTCRRCGKTYSVAHQKEEELCPECRGLRDHNLTIILRVRCSVCGKLFTTSPWDLLEVKQISDTEEIICPDCAQEEKEDVDWEQLLKGISENYKKARNEE